MATQTVTVQGFNYIPSPTGMKFHESDAFVKLVVGPYGSGKTCMIMNDALYYCLNQAPAQDGVRYTRIGVVRGTYPELVSTTRGSIIEVFPATSATYVPEVCRYWALTSSPLATDLTTTCFRGSRGSRASARCATWSSCFRRSSLPLTPRR